MSRTINANENLTTDEEKLAVIKEILIEWLKPERILLFGSRASGTQTEHSDFDIAVEGAKATFRELRKAKEQLDHGLGIYSCDLVELEKTSEDFRYLIKQQGTIIYERD